MKTLRIGLASLLVFGAGMARAGQPDLAAEIDLTNTTEVLPNGLTVIVHEDHKAPIVAVDLWYHVGSKNERPGKHGFAHLFEHLMFTGSQHLGTGHNQRAFFETMEKVGATDLNGTTSEDRTDFFEDVPKNALDTALWIESDRMGTLLQSIDQQKLEQQRGVVENEKRQDENQPYGVVDELIVKGTAPEGHPYSWTTIGSMEDLDAASLDDVRAWFRTYYGAANVVLAVSGDVRTPDALAAVKKYFSSVPSGPPIAHYKEWVAPLRGVRRETVSDHVPQARIYETWNVPRYGDADATRLDLLSDVLSDGKTSRLYKRLVYDEQIATDVSASVDEREINSQFQIVVTVRPRQDIDRAERDVSEELARLLKDGPAHDELARAKTEYASGFIRGIERLGGFGGVSDILAMNQTYRGSPDYYKTVLRQAQSATMDEVRDAGRRWLTNGAYILRVLPFPEYASRADRADRSHLPAPGEPPPVEFPALQRTNLANGLKVIVATRRGLPLVTADLLIDAGYAADEFALPGTASMAMTMLDEGTRRRNALQISDELERLGAELSADANLDMCSVHLSALTPNLADSLSLFADVSLNPSFPEADFRRVQQQRLAEIRDEKSDPRALAMRLLPALLYGKGHAYGNPFTGTGTESSVDSMTRGDVVRFHQTWFKPGNSTLVLVGDIDLAEVLPEVKKLFANWEKGDVPRKNIGPVSQPQRDVYLVDRPGSLQSMIMAADIAPPTGNPDEIAQEMLNVILGGTFTSRINMNLREDKHWAYGAHSMLMPAEGPSPFIAWAPVQTDKTSDSMAELNKELHAIISPLPVSESELETAQKNQTLKLPGQWETEDHVEASIARIARFDLPDDYYETYPAKVRALTVSQVEDQAPKIVHPDNLVWVVVGDRSKIEQRVHGLGWGKLHFLDSDGNSTQ